VFGFHVKCLFICNFKQNWYVLTIFSNSPLYKISRKSVQFESHVPCGQTHNRKLVPAFHNCWHA